MRNRLTVARDLLSNDGAIFIHIDPHELCYTNRLPGISKAVNWQGGGSFVSCELAKANQIFVDEIEQATSKEQLTQIWGRMQATGFLSWKLSPKMINDVASEFADLSVEEMKLFLIESLDKNLLYVPLSEINNSEFAISDADKTLNLQFYGKAK